MFEASVVCFTYQSVHQQEGAEYHLSIVCHLMSFVSSQGVIRRPPPPPPPRHPHPHHFILPHHHHHHHHHQHPPHPHPHHLILQHHQPSSTIIYHPQPSYHHMPSLLNACRSVATLRCTAKVAEVAAPTSKSKKRGSFGPCGAGANTNGVGETTRAW